MIRDMGVYDHRILNFPAYRDGSREGDVTKYAFLLSLYPSGFYGYACIHVVTDSRRPGVLMRLRLKGALR